MRPPEPVVPPARLPSAGAEAEGGAPAGVVNGPFVPAAAAGEPAAGTVREGSGRAAERGARVLPARAECLAAAFRSGRAAFSPALFGPAALAALLAWLLAAWLLPAAPRGAAGVILASLGWAAIALLLWLALAQAAALAAWGFGRGERLGAAEGFRLLGARWRSVLGGPLFVPQAALILLAVLAVPAWLLGLIPAIGGALAVLWLAVPGLPLGLLLAGILVLGVPALPLILAASVVEETFPFDAAARGMSYLRGRPCRWLATFASGVAGAAASALLFALLLALAASALIAAGRLAVSGFDRLLGELPRDLAAALAGADPFWPFWRFRPAAAAPAPGPLASCALVIAGRLVTGFMIAAAGSVLARTYLLQRWAVDGEAPGALVRPGEEIDWSR